MFWKILIVTAMIAVGVYDYHKFATSDFMRIVGVMSLHR